MVVMMMLLPMIWLRQVFIMIVPVMMLGSVEEVTAAGWIGSSSWFGRRISSSHSNYYHINNNVGIFKLPWYHYNPQQYHHNHRHDQHQNCQESICSMQLLSSSSSSSSTVPEESRNMFGDTTNNLHSMTTTAGTTMTTNPVVSPKQPQQQHRLLSMSLDELSLLLGGRGRALALWDCFRLGIDPRWFYHTNHEDDDEKYCNDNHGFEPIDNYPPPTLVTEKHQRQSSSTLLSSSNMEWISWNRHQCLDAMPSSRRRQHSLVNLTKIMMQLDHQHSNNNNNNNSPMWLWPNQSMHLKQISTSSDGTTKLLFQLLSSTTTSHTPVFEELLETVIIPWSDRQSSTLCLSSQVGCRQACTFCATGSIMGYGRNVTADEILAQVYWAIQVTRRLVIIRNTTWTMNSFPTTTGDTTTTNTGVSSFPQQPWLYPIDNIVFMGMGEPADNAESVMRAVHVLINPQQFQMTPRKITISTVAPTPQAFDLFTTTIPTSMLEQTHVSSSDHHLLPPPPATHPSPGQVGLAWSIHSSRDTIRKRLVPTTRYSMIEIRDGLIRTLQQRPRKSRSILLSVTLLQNINDSPEDAWDLVQFCQPIFQQVPDVKVVWNLIPWNRFDHEEPKNNKKKMIVLEPSSSERILAFQNVLLQNKLSCYIRTTRGDDNHAACGQLATTTMSTTIRTKP